MIASSFLMTRFVLTIDASDVGLGVVLSTECGSVIEFGSRTLTTMEQKYTTTEKECSGILWAICKFCHDLIGAHFTLETDHNPLEWLESSWKSQGHSQHLECWSLELRAHDFPVVHRPGRCNQTADALLCHPINLVASNPPLDLQQISDAQHSDSVLTTAMKQLTPPPNSGTWTLPKLFPYQNFQVVATMYNCNKLVSRLYYGCSTCMKVVQRL